MTALSRSAWLVMAAACALVAMPAQAQRSQRSLLKEFEAAFVELSEDMRPSVVEISAEGKVDEESRGRLDDLRRFFGQPRPEGDGDSDPTPQRLPTSTGSGFVYDRLGHIVTNNHVVKDTSSLTVTLWDGEEREAVVVGQDPGADLAVIKIDPAGLNLKPVRMGTSESLKVGQFAIAMGSPSGLTGSFSYGHVTGLGRESLQLPDEDLRFQNFIQTDAAINLGNSGGPLCNIDGEVIGVNVAIVYRANSIGFAIPADRVKNVVPQLITSGKMIRGWLGVSIQDVEVAALSAELEVDQFLDAHSLPDDTGTFVQRVTPDGPAQEAGLQPDDVIRKIEGNVIKGATHLINTVSDIPPGEVARIDIWRKGKPLKLAITIGEFPGMLGAQYGRPIFGMYLQPEFTLNDAFMEKLEIEESPANFYVAEVEDDSPAARVGVRSGDIVMEVAHQSTADLEDFKRVMQESAKAGKTLLMKVVNLNQPPEAAAKELKEPRKIYLKIPDDYTP